MTKNLEVQLGQMANIVSGRAQGTIPSDIEKIQESVLRQLH